MRWWINLGRSRASFTPAQVQAEIANELPIGTPRSVVEALLDRKGFGHMYVERSDFPDETRTEVAIIRHTWSSYLITASIQMKFKFDMNDRLESFTVKEELTGP
jgi:hypothetical protein